MNRFIVAARPRGGICSIDREESDSDGWYMCRVRVELDGVRRPEMERTLKHTIGNKTNLCMTFKINDRHWDIICSVLRRSGWRRDMRRRFSDFDGVVRDIKAA